MNQQLSVIDMLSIICFYLTIETMNDNKLLEEHLQRQDEHINTLIEVLKNDNR